MKAKILILSSLIYNKVNNYLDYADIFVDEDDYKEVYGFIVEKLKAGQPINVSSLYSIFEISQDSVWDKVINYNFPNDEVFSSYFNDSTKRLRIALLKSKKETYKSQLPKITNNEEIYSIMAKIKELDELIKKLTTL